MMPGGSEKVDEAKQKIRTYLNKARISLEEAKTECDSIFPTWQKIGNVVDEILDSLEQILAELKSAN